VKPDTQNVLLVLLGGALVKIASTDLYLRYVKPGNQWYLLTAGAVILGWPAPRCCGMPGWPGPPTLGAAAAA